MEELHTIVDLSDPDEIRRDIDACATRWPRDQPWITRTMHRTVRVWRQGPAMRASRQWAPVFLSTAGGTGVRGDAEQYPSTEDSSRRPRARSKRPSCSFATGGCGTTCCTKDTRPSWATHTVRPPSVSPSVGLRMRSIVPSARAALGVLGYARSDARTLNSFGNLAMPLSSFFSPLRSASIGTGSSRDGHPTRPRTTAHRRGAGTRAGRRVLMTQTRTPALDTHDERPRRSHLGTLGWDTNKRLMAGHVRERGSDHVNVPTAPGAGHEE